MKNQAPYRQICQYGSDLNNFNHIEANDLNSIFGSSVYFSTSQKPSSSVDSCNILANNSIFRGTVISRFLFGCKKALNNGIQIVQICFPFLLTLLLLTNCKPTENSLRPESPEVYHNPIPDLPMSRFSIPVKFLISALEHEVNNHVGEVLYEDHNILDDNITLKVIKSGRLTLHPQGKIITYKFPIRIEAAYQQTLGSVSEKQSISCELMIDFASSFAVGSNWELIPHTEYKGFEWITKPTAQIGKAHQDLSGWIETAIVRQSDDMGSKIDDYLRRHLDIRSIIDEAWEQIQDPIEAPAMTLVFQPHSVTVTPLTAMDGNIQLHLNILMHTKSYAVKGKIPGKKVLLPEPAMVDMMYDTGFVAHVSTKVSYGQLDTLLNKNLSGHPFSFDNGKQNISLSELHCFSSGDKMMIKAKVMGSINGIVYIKAIPYLDTIKKAICIRNVDFELKTKDMLAASAAWLLNGSIEHKIQHAVEIPYARQIQLAKDQINCRMQRVKVGDNVEVRTVVDNINPHSLFVTHNYLDLRTIAVGSMDVVLY